MTWERTLSAVVASSCNRCCKPASTSGPVEQGKQRLEVDSETGIGLVLPSDILGYTEFHRSLLLPPA